ncbi:PAS domain S-box protein [Xylophilus sp. ASV27]|uniref:PAS domain S-box protein n=1 Tax=Xylophilus sp. ASV27 TaxID=2795129 RepID=UPI0018EC0FAF|nr:PAS domain S-box protein [Xylophilus sp. ASV27]
MSPAHSLPRGVKEHSVFRSIFAAYPDSLLIADQAGTIVLANPSAAALLGYTMEDLVGLNIDALVPDSIRPCHASYRAAYAQAPHPRPMGTEMDLVARRKDGSEVMVEIALSPLQDQGLPLVVAAIRGVEAYPRVQQALQRARYSEHLAQFGRLAVDARDPQALLDDAPLIAAEALRVQTAMVVLLESDQQAFRVVSGVGLVPGEEVGARISAAPDTSPGFLLTQERPVVVPDYRTEQRFSVPPSYLVAGLVSSLSVPLFDRGRVIGTLAVRSREPKRFGDEELRFLGSLSSLLSTSLQRAQTEETLQHAQRLETVGQLTGGIAHDFNNLLTIIQGNLQVLEELPGIRRNGHAGQLVSAAMRAGHRAAELTGKLLAFSRRQVLQPSAVDMGAMLLSLVDMLRRTLDQHIRIEVEVAPGCPPVLADPGQLESALLNIAVNARDAMPEGGTLRFSAQPCNGLAPRVRRELDYPGSANERFVEIRIADTGIGMPDAVKERAVEPFFTTKEAGRGTGLGLSTVYGFARQSRGALTIDSAPGAGTTVALYIPQPLAAAEAGPQDAPASDAVPPGLQVLLVEDDAEVRKVVQAFLAALGCRIATAANAEQALAALGGGQPFDLLLTDIALGPGMRGTALAAEARARLPRLSVLLMSGFSSELLDADRDAPADWDLLRKPFTRQELAQAIVRVLK